MPLIQPKNDRISPATVKPEGFSIEKYLMKSLCINVYVQSSSPTARVVFAKTQREILRAISTGPLSGRAAVVATEIPTRRPISRPFVPSKAW